MKKIIGVLLLSILFVTGCGNNMNTPTNAVENYLNKYQNLDGEVTAQLDNVISSDVSMNDEQKKDYKELMLNQYKNFSYKIVDEKVNDDEAEVEVEIEVLDYASSIGESRIYYKNHQDEFKNDKETKDDENKSDDSNDLSQETDDSLVEDTMDAIDNISSFIDYKIKNMKNVTNTTKDTITIYLSKVGKEWVVEDLSDTDLEKLHGLFEG